MFTSKDLFNFDLDPIDNFSHLFKEAHKHPPMDPTAMTLATMDIQGRPDARIVLLKNVDQEGFTFFTNYNSVKAQQLAKLPEACLVFYWAPMGVQVRLSGLVTKVERAESEAYFKTRPRLSQIGAWASEQSAAIESYETLELNLENMEQRFANKDVPCPEHWGGYRVYPMFMEFWFGMEGRLHFRYMYERSGKHWLRAMKSP